MERQLDAQRVCTVLDETVLAVRLLKSLEIDAEDEEIENALGHSVATLLKNHMRLEDDYSAFISQQQSSAGPQRHQQVKQADLQGQVMASFRELHRRVRADAELLERLEGLAGDYDDDDDMEESNDYVHAAECIAEFCRLSKDHVAHIAQHQAKSLSKKDRKQQVDELGKVLTRLREEHESLIKALEKADVEANASLQRQRIQLRRLNDDKMAKMQQLKANEQGLHEKEDKEFGAMNEEHREHTHELQALIEQRKEELERLKAQHMEEERTLKREFKALESKLEAKVQEYDDEMMALTERVDNMTDLYKDESQRLQEIQSVIDRLMDERQHYETDVLAVREAESNRQRRMAEASKLMQETYLVWHTDEVARKKREKTAAAAAKKKKDKRK